MQSVRCNMFHENGHKTSPKLELISTNIAHKERLNQTLCILNSTLFSLHGSDLFLLGKGGVNQWGIWDRRASWFVVSLICFPQKKSRRCASSFSKEATDNPWMLATPRTTKLRYDTSGASCLKTCRNAKANVFLANHQQIKTHETHKFLRSHRECEQL